MATNPTSASHAGQSTGQNSSPPFLRLSLQDKDNTQAGRRPSIQFKTFTSTDLPTGSPKATRLGRRRLSSPPPPPTFRPRVSFDTFDKPADFIEENSFTLISKHRDYEYTKRSRTFLCGLDSNDYSEYALNWLIDELVDDGDEIVCLRVVEKDEKVANDSSIEKGRYKAEAEAMMDSIQEKNKENKAINLVLEFSVGKVNKVIDEMINLYEPAILVVGTKGRSLGGFQGLMPGSVSKYCLQHSPVPVIVVRPNSKRAKAKIKRLDDSSRQVYRDILDKSGLDGGHPLHFDSKNSYFDDSRAASDDEAAAVAAAVGYKSPREQQHPLTTVQTSTSAYSTGSVAVESTAGDSSVGGEDLSTTRSTRIDTGGSPSISPTASSDSEGGGVSTRTVDDVSTAVPVDQDRAPENTAHSTTVDEDDATTSKVVHRHKPKDEVEKLKEGATSES